MTDKQKALISIILAALFTGGNGVASKFALQSIHPFTFTFLRFLIAFIWITPFLLKEGGIKKPSLWVFLFSLIMVINPTSYTFGIRLTTVTASQTLFAGTPVVIALFAYYLIKEKISAKRAIGITIGFIGSLIIILLPVIEKHSTFSGNILGNIFISVSVICLSLYTVLSKKLHEKYSPIYLTALFIYFTTIVNFIIAIPEISANPNFLTTISFSSWLGLFYAGIFGVSFFLLNQYAIKHGSPIIAATINYLSPIFAFVAAFTLLGERLTSGFIIGAIFALVGVSLTTLSKKAKLQN